MKKFLIWFTKKFLNEKYWKNPLCSFKLYRYLRGGEWVLIDWHWLKTDKTGRLRDVQGRIYTYTIPPSCIREYNRMSK
jgi:hypothetical protein